MDGPPGTTSSSVAATSQAPMPSYLPPKSPASITSKFLLSTANRSIAPRRKRSKSKSSKGRTQQQSRLSGDRVSPSKRPDQSLHDPCPDHLNVAAGSDDLAFADFSALSFENASRTSVVEAIIRDDGSKMKPVHRKAKSWDSSDCYNDASHSKTCLPVPALFRRQKVMCADVASVSNASDTIVPLKGKQVSGRELHETAKTLLNEGEYDQSLAIFEAILVAQKDRFGGEHPSVGAAMHNVGVVRLRMGHHELAEEILAKTVVIREKVLGSDHLDLAVSPA